MIRRRVVQCAAPSEPPPRIARALGQRSLARSSADWRCRRGERAVEDEFGSFNRVEFTSPDLFLLDVYWSGDAQ